LYDIGVVFSFNLSEYLKKVCINNLQWIKACKHELIKQVLPKFIMPIPLIKISLKSFSVKGLYWILFLGIISILLIILEYLCLVWFQANS
jgi:hypothetical protein